MQDEPQDLFVPDPALAEALDAYIGHASGSPSRSEAVIRILRDWLATNGYLRSDPLPRLGEEAGEFPVELVEHDKPA